MIPGGNLLATALGVIGQQSFIYRQFKERTTNNIGIDVPAYETDVPLKGSIQPVPRSLYQDQGLDWKKNYITIYSTDTVEGVNRDESGSLIVFNGKTYQTLSENDWVPMDGWNGVLCVQV